MQDCPDGQKCTAWASDGGNSWNDVKCVPVDPNPKKPGEPCLAPEGGVAGVDDCEFGAMCWDVDEETKEGICVDLCEGSANDPMCPPGTLCTISNAGVLILCRSICDPLAQDCPEGQSCLPYSGSESFVCLGDYSGDAGAFGDLCEYLNGCDPGLACLKPEYVPDCMSGGCCSPFCDTTALNTCPGDGQECIPWFMEGQAPARRAQCATQPGSAWNTPSRRRARQSRPRLT